MPTSAPRACHCGRVACAVHVRVPFPGIGTSAQRGYSSTDYLRNRSIVMAEEQSCAMCGAAAQAGDHCDHILPRSQGGTHERANLRRLCRTCNLGRTNRGRGAR